MRIAHVFLAAALCWSLSPAALAQSGDDDAFRAAVEIASGYSVNANLTYLSASGHDFKLDLYHPRPGKAATTVLLNIHGGGWVRPGQSSPALALICKAPALPGICF